MTLAAAVIVSGCATPKIAELEDTMILPEPPEIRQPEPKPQPPARDVLPEKRPADLFSLSVRDADLRDVFLLLSKDSGVNIIADMDVAGTISIDFTDLTLESALYAITRQLGLTFWPDKGFIRVSRPTLDTRSFRMNYITGTRSSSSTMSAAITGSGGYGGAYGSTSNINLNLTGTADTAAATSSGSSSGQGNVNVTTSGTSDFWRDVRTGLEVIIFGDTQGGTQGGFSRGDKTGKKLIISELAGLIQVTDYSDNMERIEDFLRDVQKSVRKQVMIQAHIIEVSLNDTYKLGIDWELITRSGAETFTISQGLLTSPPSEVFQLDYDLVKSSETFTALIDAMKEQGQVNILSSPTVSSMNNQKAVIKLSTKEVSWVTSSYLNATGDVLLSYTSPQIDEVGLFLDVTPQVADNGVITMQIHPSISEKLRDSVSPDGESIKPVIDTREVDTVIKTRNGQTIVIAGLITDKLNDNIRSVPVLGDIPVVGTFFKQTVQEKRKSELVILITPYVLTDQSVEDIRVEHINRLKKAGRVFESVPGLKKDL